MRWAFTDSVHTQAYFNPDPATNQTIALVADTKAYLAANPHAVQIVRPIGLCEAIHETPTDAHPCRA